MTIEAVDKIEELATLAKVRGNLRVGTAESCTGGLLASWICAYPGASRFFNGAVVGYARSVKHELLGVPMTLLQTHGEVSVPVARAMAEGARVVLGVDWAVSVTGIAGPSGGSVEKPVGLVCFSVVGPGFVKAVQHVFEAQKGRQDIQRQAALFAFDFLLNAMR